MIAEVARDRTVSAEIVAATTALDVS